MSVFVETKNQVIFLNLLFVQDASIYVGNLDEKINEEILWEVMLQVILICSYIIQAGPVVSIHIPRDKLSNLHQVFCYLIYNDQGYGFVEFRSEEDADYAMKIMNMVYLT